MPNNANSEIYVICSDDPLLKLDRSRELLARWRQFVPDAEFLLYTYSELQGTGGSPNLKGIENEMSDPGLFGGERIIKVILKDMDTTAIELFKLIAANMRPGLFILIELPRITAKLAKSKEVDSQGLHRFLTFREGSAGAEALAQQSGAKGGKGGRSSAAKKKTATRSRKGEAAKSEAIGYLRDVGAQFEILYPPEGAQLKSWISQRAGMYGFRVNNDALDFIARSCDNNLLTIDHSLQVLQMMAEADNMQQMKVLDLKSVEDYFTQDARYNGFELPEAIFNGDSLKALTIIASFCSGHDTNLSTALGLLINRMDSSISTVYEGKQQNLQRAHFNTQTAFFMSHNLKVPSSQKSHLKAMQVLTDGQLEELTSCLSEASCSYSTFDLDGAYRALQRMALAATQPGQTRFLSADLLVF